MGLKTVMIARIRGGRGGAETRFGRANSILGLASFLVFASVSSDITQAHAATPAETSPQRETVTNSPASQPVTNASAADNGYRIQSLDTIQINVFGEPDLSVRVRVSSQGNINYPLLGSVHVGGLTVSETEARLKEQLGRNFLVNPQVNVLIDRANSRRVFVLGQVKAPGAYDIPADEGLTVVQAIARAGGFTELAAVDRVNIIRTEHGAQSKIVVKVGTIMKGSDGSKDIPLKPDDVVVVSETLF